MGASRSIGLRIRPGQTSRARVELCLHVIADPDRNGKRFYYETHAQLRTQLADLLAAYNFARRLKTRSGLTPYEYICKIWTSESDRLILDPIHQMPGLYR